MAKPWGVARLPSSAVRIAPLIAELTIGLVQGVRGLGKGLDDRRLRSVAHSPAKHPRLPILVPPNPRCYFGSNVPGMERQSNGTCEQRRKCGACSQQLPGYDVRWQ